MGFGNLLHNCGHYDEAITMYKKVVSLKPKFINAYVAICFIREYQRPNKKELDLMLKKL
jgi:hypothetical protein